MSILWNKNIISNVSNSAKHYLLGLLIDLENQVVCASGISMNFFSVSILFSFCCHLSCFFVAEIATVCSFCLLLLTCGASIELFTSNGNCLFYTTIVSSSSLFFFLTRKLGSTYLNHNICSRHWKDVWTKKIQGIPVVWANFFKTIKPAIWLLF
jgi:hypothetical protein